MIMMHPHIYASLRFIICVLSFQISYILSKLSENIIEHYDHLILSDSRIIIDNAIPPDMVKELYDFCLAEPKLQNVDTFLEFHGPSQFSSVDLGDIIRGVYRELDVNHKAVNLKVGPGERIYQVAGCNNTFLSTTNKQVKFSKTAIRLQSIVLDFADAFFHKKFQIRSGTLFKRHHMPLGKSARTSYDSPKNLNDAHGWMVPLHCDSCILHPKTFGCDHTPSIQLPEENLEFTFRDLSVILFLNEFEVATGGEFVFVDALHRDPSAHLRSLPFADTIKLKDNSMKGKGSHTKNEKSSHSDISTSKASSSDGGISDGNSEVGKIYKRRELSTDSLYHVDPTDTSIILPSPPSREQIRRKLTRDQSNSYASQAEASNIKHVTVHDHAYNYTVVFPRAGRLVIFNCSIDQVHAVTNLLKESDHRYTFFMFLTELR